MGTLVLKVNGYGMDVGLNPNDNYVTCTKLPETTTTTTESDDSDTGGNIPTFNYIL